jgi:hypothetical protein
MYEIQGWFLYSTVRDCTTHMSATIQYRTVLQMILVQMSDMCAPGPGSHVRGHGRKCRILFAPMTTTTGQDYPVRAKVKSVTERPPGDLASSATHPIISTSLASTRGAPGINVVTILLYRGGQF